MADRPRRLSAPPAALRRRPRARRAASCGRAHPTPPRARPASGRPPAARGRRRVASSSSSSSLSSPVIESLNSRMPDRQLAAQAGQALGPEDDEHDDQDDDQLERSDGHGMCKRTEDGRSPVPCASGNALTVVSYEWPVKRVRARPMKGPDATCHEPRSPTTTTTSAASSCPRARRSRSSTSTTIPAPSRAGRRPGVHRERRRPARLRELRLGPRLPGRVGRGRRDPLGGHAALPQLRVGRHRRLRAGASSSASTRSSTAAPRPSSATSSG